MMTGYLIPLADVNQQVISPAAVREANRSSASPKQRHLTPYNLLERMLVPGVRHPR